MIVKFRVRLAIVILPFLLCLTTSSVFAQQKPQWMPGQMGLNAGILPSPGVTYVNMDINYDAGTYNDRLLVILKNTELFSRLLHVLVYVIPKSKVPKMPVELNIL